MDESAATGFRRRRFGGFRAGHATGDARGRRARATLLGLSRPVAGAVRPAPGFARSRAQGRQRADRRSSPGTPRKAAWSRQFAEPATCDAARARSSRTPRSRLIERWIAAGRGMAEDRDQCQGAGADMVVVQEAGAPAGSGAKDAWVRTPVDAFILQKLNHRKTEAGARSGPPHARSPRLPRSPRTSAHRRADREVRQRSRARRLREADRRAARLAALRREVGPPLARSRPATATRGLRAGSLPSLRVALSRLRHRFLQQRQALRPLRQGADRRRRALSGRSGRR